MSITPEQARNLAAILLNDSGPVVAPIGEGRRCSGAAARDASPPPERIAGYRVTRIIAAGGMGEVYEAEQDKPRRTVAIKVMKRGLASRTALRRFEWEAELLGSLRHPGIATVFEAGTWDDGSGGVPYFVMEFIPGAMPITRYARQRGLEIRRRLELFAQVCDAVQHGHQKGIIHRDLKPGNILVGEEGVEASRPQGIEAKKSHEERTADYDEGGVDPLPSEEEGEATGANARPHRRGGDIGRPIVKIIDFGIARATDSDIAVTTMHTEVGQLIGTLQYMSPEQCEGNARDLDTRSDVYALGMVLYELICDQLPYDVSTTSIPHATRMIQDTVPDRPSAIDRKLRGDLETIVLKALEKDREKRYQSAGELGEDVRRHLRGEPIQARRAGRWERSVRWAGRHPLVTTGAACAVMLAATVASGFIAIWWVNLMPFRVELLDDRREIRLYSIGDRMLFSRRAQPGGSFGGVFLLDRPAELGGGQLFVVGVGPYDKELPGGVHVYDVESDWSWDRPLWSRLVTADSLPVKPGTRTLIPERFHVQHVWTMDVFAASPGPEIVAVHKHGEYSQSCVRVYGLDGAVLYQFWHDGGPSDSHYDAMTNRLFFSSVDAECYWEGRGFKNISQVHPFAVFAVEPQLGQRIGWVRADDTDAKSAWYKFILPPLSEAAIKSVTFGATNRD